MIGILGLSLLVWRSNWRTHYQSAIKEPSPYWPCSCFFHLSLGSQSFLLPTISSWSTTLTPHLQLWCCFQEPSLEQVLPPSLVLNSRCWAPVNWFSLSCFNPSGPFPLHPFCPEAEGEMAWFSSLHDLHDRYGIILRAILWPTDKNNSLKSNPMRTRSLTLCNNLQALSEPRFADRCYEPLSERWTSPGPLLKEAVNLGFMVPFEVVVYLSKFFLFFGLGGS